MRICAFTLCRGPHAVLFHGMPDTQCTVANVFGIVYLPVCTICELLAPYGNGMVGRPLNYVFGNIIHICNWRASPKAGGVEMVLCAGIWQGHVCGFPKAGNPLTFVHFLCLSDMI